MKKSIWVLAILYGCGGGSSPSAPVLLPEPVPEPCAVTVIWEAPTMRRSGLPLSPEDFNKFTIYVGEAPGRNNDDLIMVIDIPDKAATTHRIEGLPNQDSYIYITVTDTEGETSSLSQEWSWDCVTGKLYEG